MSSNNSPNRKKARKKRGYHDDNDDEEVEIDEERSGLDANCYNYDDNYDMNEEVGGAGKDADHLYPRTVTCDTH